MGQARTLRIVLGIYRATRRKTIVKRVAMSCAEFGFDGPSEGSVIEFEVYAAWDRRIYVYPTDPGFWFCADGSEGAALSISFMPSWTVTFPCGPA